MSAAASTGPREGTTRPAPALRLTRGDITRVHADAIVNAANSQLLPGGGVCGAINRAGGKDIAREGRAWVEAHGPVPVGDAAPTSAGDLDARHVIHSVGPVWSGGDAGEADLLASAYRRAVEVADELGDETIAFPSLSTGIFGYPVEQAAPVALHAVADAMAAASNVREVTFVLFDDESFTAYDAARAALAST